MLVLRQLVMVALLGAASAARADDWELRREPPKATQPASRGPARHAGRALEPSKSDRDAAQRGRYLDLLMRTPSDRGAFERLLQLYRARDGGLEGLERELRERIADRAGARSPALWALHGRVVLELGQLRGARESFARVQAFAPTLPLGYVLAAELERGQGDLLAADALFARALQRSRRLDERRELIEQRVQLSLERGDFDAAVARHRELRALGPSSAYVETALARALALRGEHARAAAAYREAAARLQGDARALAPVLIEQARSELAAGETSAARTTLQRARPRAEPGARHAIDELLLDAHRREGTLAELAEQLRARTLGAEDALLLARVAEELGDFEGAIAAYRRRLALRASDAEGRERLIALLARVGRTDEMLTEQRKLVASRRGEPAPVVRLAQALLDAGRPAEAQRVLDEHERRFGHQPRMAQALLELYARWGDSARAERVLERLVRAQPGQAAHAFALGELLLERGDAAGARAAFTRGLRASGSSARAHAELGALLVAHDLAEQAVEHYERALAKEPESTDALRGLADALDRSGRPADAAQRWQRVLSLAGSDRALLREARTRLVMSWSHAHELRQRVSALERTFGAGHDARTPRGGKLDLEVGRLLAEAYLALAREMRRRGGGGFEAKAEAVLYRIAAQAPGDVDALAALERLSTARGDESAARKVLARLLEADPANASQYLSRLAELALARYDDDAAIEHVRRMIELAPNDARAHARLAQLSRSQHDLQAAAASYARSLELDPLAHGVGLDYAELELTRGERAHADALFLQVLRGAHDDELVRRAARQLLQLRLAAGALESLEQELLALAWRQSDRAVHRGLLLELYELMARPLLARIERDADSAAREALRAITARAAGPLLQVLTRDPPAARRAALELLVAAPSEPFVLPLLGFAEREGDLALRRRALLAAARVAGPELLDRFVAFAESDERRLSDVGAWACARLAFAMPSSARPDRTTLALQRVLLRLASSAAAGVRAYALLGLGALGAAESAQLLASGLERDGSATVRAAASLALTLQGAPRAFAPALTHALHSDTEQVAAAAALALADVREPETTAQLATAALRSAPLARRAALWALARAADASTALHLRALELPAPAEPASVAPLVLALSGSYSDDATVLAERPQRSVLDAAAADALADPREAAQALSVLLASGGRSEAAWPDVLRTRVLEACVEVLVALTRAPEPATRTLALRALVHIPSAESAAALGAALESHDPDVRALALDRLDVAFVRASAAFAALAPALERIARHGAAWPERRRAVELLAASGSPRTHATLRAVLERDAHAYVRDVAARALRALGPDSAASVLESVRTRDPEPAVRRAAAAPALSVPGSGEARSSGEGAEPPTSSAPPAR